jgi:hypothetical protein
MLSTLKPAEYTNISTGLKRLEYRLSKANTPIKLLDCFHLIKHLVDNWPLKSKVIWEVVSKSQIIISSSELKNNDKPISDKEDPVSVWDTIPSTKPIPKVSKKPSPLKKALKSTVPSYYINKSIAEQILTTNVILEADDKDPTVAKHLADLSKFSEKTLSMLKEAGVTWYIGNTTVTSLNHNERLKGVIPRGWRGSGKTWDDVSGGYFPNQNQVCTGKGAGSTTSLMGHETGHAIFFHTIENDLTKRSILNKLHKKHYSWLNRYISQGGPGGFVGMKEMFCEMMANSISNSPLHYGILFRQTPDREEEFNTEAKTILQKWGLL